MLEIAEIRPSASFTVTAYKMTTNRFHKAAQDGFEVKDILKEATKKDCNSRDEQGMTPTLYAAFHGHYNVLSLLCARGGDPDKADFFGNTALHLAAAQGHLDIVKFLIKFGVNIYAMDIDRRTPQGLAGLNNRDEILQVLDKFRGDLEADDKMTRKVRAMKEKAKKDVEKTLNKYYKYNKQQRIYQTDRDVRRPTTRPSIIHTLKMRVKSGSMSNLNQPDQQMPRNSFSALVSGGTMNKKSLGMGTVQRRAMAKKGNVADNGEFIISTIEDGKRTTRSIKGSRHDTDVLLTGAIEGTGANHLESMFNEAEDALDNTISGSGTLHRSKSQPDFLQQLNENQASIFSRPDLGSFAFGKSIRNFVVAEPTVDDKSSIESRYEDDVDLLDSDNSDDDVELSAIERFLTACGLGEYLPRFEDQKIDLDTLMILTETDLKTLGLPLGHFRKLVNGINERKGALENPGDLTDGTV